jgi:hypothetical protein
MPAQSLHICRGRFSTRMWISTNIVQIRSAVHSNRSPYGTGPRYPASVCSIGAGQTLGRPAHAFPKQVLDQRYEAVRIEWLKAEYHIQTLVGGFGIGKAAEHYDR